MTPPVNSRPYDSTIRRAAALETRRRILTAAHDLFLRGGYAGTTLAAIARRASVSVDTVYASVGRKPELLVAVHDRVLAEGDDPLVAEERGYVQAVRAATSAREKLQIYADALGRLLPRTAPLMLALKAAGIDDPACREAHDAVSRRRAANMRLLAAELRATGELRADLTDARVADLVWSMNSPEYFQLLRDGGHSPDAYAELVADVWCRALLTP